MNVSLAPGALLLFDTSLVVEKEPLSMTIVIIDGDKDLANQCQRVYNLTSQHKTLEALQNAFILIYRCEINPYYVHILFT